MISRVVVDHYKSIDHLDLSFDGLTVLVGPNGTGKSNVVDALRLVRDALVVGMDRAVSERHGIDSIRQWSPTRPYLVTIRIEVENARSSESGYLSFTLASRAGSYVVHREEAMWNFLDPSGSRRRIHYQLDTNGRVRISESGEKIATLSPESSEELFLRQFGVRMRNLRRTLSDFEAYSIFPNTLRSPQKSSSDRRLSTTGDNFTSIFKMLTKSKRSGHLRARQEIMTAMRKVLPNLENIRIQSIGGLMVPVFRVREPSGKLHDFNVSQISDGTLRALGILTALYQPSRPAMIAMEEPEQTINPAILAVLADAIRDVSRSTQVVITTHSPDLVDKFRDPRVIRAVEMVDGITRVGAVNEDQREAVKQRLFSLGELMSMEGLRL